MKYLQRCFLVLSALCAATLQASEWEYSGHAKLLATSSSYQADDLVAVVAGQTELYDLNGNLRLNLKREWQNWDVNLHYQLVGMSGDSTGLDTIVNPFNSGTTGSDDGRLFNLSSVISDDGYTRWVQRMDRLNVGYSSGNWVMRMGRQAISWGNGINFHPLDIFNPFSPLSLDTEYKNGDDLLYLQWLANDSADLQFIYLPRRDTTSGLLDNSLDSLAVKLHMMSSMGDWDLLLARHYDDTVYGLGYVRNIGGAVWRNDINLTRLPDGSDAWFIDTNMDYSWSWLNHNFYGYAEWFHNSLGQAQVDLTTVDAELITRLQRGELYSLADNLISLGVMMEISPRWQANLNLLYQPGDKGYFASMMFSYDWQQNASLIMGARLPGGPRGSEYGGVYLVTADGSGYATAPSQLFMYVQYYY